MAHDSGACSLAEGWDYAEGRTTNAFERSKNISAVKLNACVPSAGNSCEKESTSGIQQAAVSNSRAHILQDTTVFVKELHMRSGLGRDCPLERAWGLAQFLNYPGNTSLLLKNQKIGRGNRVSSWTCITVGYTSIERGRTSRGAILCGHWTSISAIDVANASKSTTYHGCIQKL